MTSRKSLLLVSISLILLQLLCFGPIATHVGFYLDDWATLAYLHFAPRDGGYLGLLHHYFASDSRVIIRPIEVLHFGTIYYFAAEKPFLYHAVNMVFEAAASLLLYGLVVRLTARRCLAFAAALLLLIYPSHDSTHYWMICSSVALSLALYLGSFLCSLEAEALYFAEKKQAAWRFHFFSFVIFLLSLLNYETFLPLAALSVCTSLAVARRQKIQSNPSQANPSQSNPSQSNPSQSNLSQSSLSQSNQAQWKPALASAARTALPLVLAAVSYIIFLKGIVPLLGHGYAHAIKLDPAVMVSTVGRGLTLNFPVEAFSFFLGQAKAAAAVLTSSETARLIALVVVAAAVVVYLAFVDKKLGQSSGGTFGETFEDTSGQSSVRALLRPPDLLVLGLITIFVSYTIFGLSPDYMPTYMTMVNRVNTGASLGVALVVVAVGQSLQYYLASRPPAYVLTMAAGTAACVLLFSLADWGLARPWIVSWTTQKEVRDAVAQISGKIAPDASLLLISCPRYVMWSPVFDGVWDFQNMVRIVLNQPAFNANVVSERLSIDGGAIKDVSYGFECGRYPFDKLYLMVAPHDELIATPSPGQFIDAVGKRGLTFGLDKKTLSRWQEEAARQPKLDGSH